MKNNFKKVISLVLTVLMVLGTMSALVPFMASAEEVTYPYELKKNETAVAPNGITYRFDTNKADDENSWVKLNADGSWEISIRNGDMLWFPGVELTGTSEIYAEVTNAMNEPNNYFTGFAYGVTSSTDSTWTNTNVAVLKTYQNSKARFRAANAARSSLIKVSGSDYGNGGDTRAFDSSFTSDVWNSVAGSNGNWGPGKTVYYKVSQTGSDVVLEYGAPGVGAFVDATKTTYTASQLNAVAGGSVGYTHVWQSNDTAHIKLRIDALTITNCKVAGEAKDSYSLVVAENGGSDDSGSDAPVVTPVLPSEPIYLEKNKTATIGGVTYRFDVANPDDETVWARVNTDGTWEVSIRNGDMLWFPGVVATADSVVYGEFTNTLSAPINLSSGIAYGIKSEGGTYTTGSTAVMRTGKRIRVTPFSPNGLYGYNGSDGYGNGGDSPRYIDGKYLTENTAYDAIKNPSNGNWDGKKTVYFQISTADSTVNVEIGAPGKGSFYNGTYSLSTYSAGAVAGGSVGFVVSYQGSEDTLTQMRYDNITVTNCNVNGELKDTYTITPVFEAENGGSDDSGSDAPVVTPVLPSEPIYLEKNKTATIGGVTYRFDVANPDDETVWARVNTDGTWEVSIRNGDMLWFPGVVATADSVVYGEFTNTLSAPINLSSGIAYGIKSEGGTYTTGSTAVMRTGKRIRVTPFSPNGLYGYNGSDGYGNGGDSPRYIDGKYLTENTAYDAIKNPSNGNWDGKKTVYFQISTADSTVNVEIGAPGKGSFYNGTYSLSTYSAGAVAGGSVGFVVSYQGSEDTLTQMRYDNITVTNCNVNGELKDTYTITPVFEAEPEVKDAQVSLSLDGTIGLNFAFDASYLTNATVVATLNGKVVAEQAVVNGANVVTAPVNAKEMNDDVNFAIMVDGEVYDNHSYTVSVAEYAAELKKNAEWTALMDAMLNYGAAAQKLLNYKADGVVVADSSFDMSAIQDVTFNGNKALLDGLYMNLSLESDTVMNLYFKPAEGVTLNVTVNGEAVELVDNGDGYYVATIKGIAADELADGALIVVNGDLSFTCGALNWAKIASADANADVANVAKALAVYANEAASKN